MKRSRLKCFGCGTVIESRHRHDFVTCTCGDVSIDGGLDYQRILWSDGARYEIVPDSEE